MSGNNSLVSRPSGRPALPADQLLFATDRYPAENTEHAFTQKPAAGRKTSSRKHFDRPSKKIHDVYQSRLTRYRIPQKH
jgi:hypothetical protein